MERLYPINVERDNHRLRVQRTTEGRTVQGIMGVPWLPQDDRHPVVCVTFQDALDYTKWLSAKSGHRYRLLSEAEWEYAARGGTSTPYPWGAAASHEYANYGTEDHPGPGLSQGRDAWVGTSPVGSFPPNAFGLYDMHGNVLQWVQDCFSDGYAAAPGDGSAYQSDMTLSNLAGSLSLMNGTPACSYRMLRSGDWGDPPIWFDPRFGTSRLHPDRAWRRIGALDWDSGSLATDEDAADISGAEDT